MQEYKAKSKAELLQIKEVLEKSYAQSKAEGLTLNMSRGNPAEAQLALSMKMLDVINEQTLLQSSEGVDCRNYGGLEGLPEAKKLIADMLEVDTSNVLVGGNSSLNLMYNTIAKAVTHGILGETPWCKCDTIKFLCPAPGYDRHFAITEHFGIEMIAIPMKDEGPDMDLVERLVNEDKAIKGIWCVPKYSNPQGITYSDDTVKRFANLKPAARDFRLYWDNAYAEHHLYADKHDELLNILEECKKTDNEDLPYIFCSTSKISFPGSGIAAMVASANNIQDMLKTLMIQTIGPDKINQLRHVKFFGNIETLRAHMCKHADIIRPKFEMVFRLLDEELSGLGIAEWRTPNGGYFISFNALPGCAREIIAKAAEAGLVMTGAGATYPYGKDPEDKNIRIAPTFPDLEELEKAVNLFVLCVKIVSIEKLLEVLK